MQDAAGAALKAIQCLHLTAQGSRAPARRRRLLPGVLPERCTQCKRCTEECPFGTLDEDEKGTPKPNLNRCRRCGICMGACPERIISFKDYSIDIIASMIKSIDVSDDEDVPTFLGLVCENDAYPALDMAGLARMKYSPHIRSSRCAASAAEPGLDRRRACKGLDGMLLSAASTARTTSATSSTAASCAASG